MCLFGPGCTAISVVVLAIVYRVCGMGRRGIEVSAKLRSRCGGARPVDSSNVGELRVSVCGQCPDKKADTRVKLLYLRRPRALIAGRS
jgi:hypothetical protein